MASDRILVEGLRFECIVGVYPRERTEPQPVQIDLELHGDFSRAVRIGALETTVDYDRVADEVRALLEFRAYELLEVACEEVAAMLLGVHPSLDRVRVRIAKPQALAGRAQNVALEIERDQADFPRRWEHPPFGAVEIICETGNAGLYLLHVEPGRGIAPHHHRVMRELEWRVRGELERDGVRMDGLSPIVWSGEQVHRYDNVGSTRATLFCCDSPPFIPEDEIVVGVAETREEPG